MLADFLMELAEGKRCSRPLEEDLFLRLPPDLKTMRTWYAQLFFVLQRAKAVTPNHRKSATMRRYIAAAEVVGNRMFVNAATTDFTRKSAEVTFDTAQEWV